VITTTEEDIPTPRAGEVRVKVLAAGVGLPDVLAREGVHPETPHVPYTPGWDLIGTIDQVGEGVTGFELYQTIDPYACTGSIFDVGGANNDAAIVRSSLGLRCLFAAVPFTAHEWSKMFAVTAG
jgi:NADPH:quinone reductase-like Zn-dependent oxidoreductase